MLEQPLLKEELVQEPLIQENAYTHDLELEEDQQSDLLDTKSSEHNDSGSGSFLPIILFLGTWYILKRLLLIEFPVNIFVAVGITFTYNLIIGKFINRNSIPEIEETIDQAMEIPINAASLFNLCTNSAVTITINEDASARLTIK